MNIELYVERRKIYLMGALFLILGFTLGSIIFLSTGGLPSVQWEKGLGEKEKRVPVPKAVPSPSIYESFKGDQRRTLVLVAALVLTVILAIFLAVWKQYLNRYTKLGLQLHYLKSVNHAIKLL